MIEDAIVEVEEVEYYMFIKILRSYFDPFQRMIP